MKKIDGNFTMIPNNFITDPRLTTYDFKVLCYLCMLTDEESRCFPSYDTIVENTGVCKSTAINSVNKLSELNIISKNNRKDNNNKFWSNNYVISAITEQESFENEDDIQHFCDEKHGVSDTFSGVSATSDSVSATPSSMCDTQGSVCDTPNQYILTNNHNTNTHYTNQSSASLEELMERLEDWEIKGELKKTFAGAIEIMYTSNSITVGGEDIPRDKVRKRLENLTLEHIAAVDRNKPMHLVDGKPVSNVNNPIAYTVTALYNALAFTEEQIIEMEYGGNRMNDE